MENISNEELQEILEKLKRASQLKLTNSSSMEECIRKAIIYWKNFESHESNPDLSSSISMEDRHNFLNDIYQIIRYYMVVRQVKDGIQFFFDENNSTSLNDFFNKAVEIIGDQNNKLTVDELNAVLKKESDENESSGEI